ncbi:MAG: nickel-dependent lactate racemase [Bacillota bacterium]|jgi:nickel-dependent lactate racemase
MVLVITLRLPYGKTEVSAKVSRQHSVHLLEAKERRPSDGAAEIRRALENPVGSPRLRDLAKGVSRVSIVVNDITRPTSTKAILKGICRELWGAGVPLDGVTAIVATGTHRPATPGEIEDSLGPDLSRRLKVLNHRCSHDDEGEYLGHTARGVPVIVNRALVRSELRILTGVILPHHSAGYSGGRKSVLPGVSGLESIRVHHSLGIRPFWPSPGYLHGNPFHEEAVEAARMCRSDFIVNVVPATYGGVHKAFSGHLEEAHMAGVAVCEPLCRVTCPEMSEIVVVSPGGYPRDLDLYQGVKALCTAEMVVKPGGTVILVAECGEGGGDRTFASWMKECSNPAGVIGRYREEGFRPGANKAFMLARALTRCRVLVVTQAVTRGELETLGLGHADTLQEALNMALADHPECRSLTVIPRTSHIIPQFSNDGEGADPEKKGGEPLLA